MLKKKLWVWELDKTHMLEGKKRRPGGVSRIESERVSREGGKKKFNEVCKTGEKARRG